LSCSYYTPRIDVLSPGMILVLNCIRCYLFFERTMLGDSTFSAAVSATVFLLPLCACEQGYG